MKKSQIDKFLKGQNFNNPSVRMEITDLIICFDKSQWVDASKRQPKLGNEYNVVWDLQDGGKPLTSTMHWDAIAKTWEDPNVPNQICKAVLFWRELPKPIRKIK